MSPINALRANGEAIVFAALALVGLGALVTGSSYGVTIDGGRVGPGFLPVVAGGLTAGLCGWLAVRSVVGHQSSHEDLATPGPPPLSTLSDTGVGASQSVNDEPDITGRTQQQRTRNLWRVFALTFGAILLVQVVGFLAAFSLLVLVTSTWIERQPVPKSLAIAALAGTAVYLIFGLFLGVPLPGGLLGLGMEG